MAFAAGIDGLRLDGTLAIGGIVADSNLDDWVLELVARDGTVTTLGTGESPIDGTLAALDARTLLDGFYTLRLVARDIGGRSAVASARLEIASGADKREHYVTSRTDLSVQLGGIPFSLVRQYDSIAREWSFLGMDMRVETDVSTVRGPGGDLPGFALGSRAYVTMPDGSREGFTFTPQADVVAGQTFYRPAWTADGDHGYVLQSATTQLRQVGAQFYDVATGAAYNPASPLLEGEDYALTAPDGTRYMIDSINGTVAIITAAGTLQVSGSGITASGDAALRFIRDGQGRIIRATAPDGTTIVYEHGDAGVTSVRDLATGQGSRYGYADGRLVLEVPSDAAGRHIAYQPDGEVVISPVKSDVGAAARFTGQALSGNLAAGGSESHAFTIRESELAGTQQGTVILRVATSGTVAARIDGLDPLASETIGAQTVTLFAVSQAGLYRLGFTGTGAYTATLGIAGDLNDDARVDGADNALMQAGGTPADVTGDGQVSAADRQVLQANYGFMANRPPQLAPVLPELRTHVDLPVLLDLSKVATDPDGDRIYYRFFDANGGSASLTADGTGIVFRPAAGYAGSSSVRVVADDGFGSSAEALITIAISDAPLTAIDFEFRDVQFSGVGGQTHLALIGTFADQANVVLPYSYVQARVGDTSVLRLSADGTLLSLNEGATYLQVTRGAISAATGITVGDPQSVEQLMTQIYGIDAYPDTVTLLPSGGERRIVTRVDPEQEYYFDGAAEGTVYVSSDSSIVTVDANGLMRGVGVGRAKVTVINGWGEDVIDVSVLPASVGNAIAVDADVGAIVQNASGVQVSFGPGSLSGDAVVTVTSLAEGDMSIPMPTTDQLSFVGAFALDITGGTVDEALQIAVPVPAGGGKPGDQVWFFVSQMLPVGPNGALQEVWTVVDSGVIDADGMARAKSPPFPGLSQRGQVLIARAAQPLPTLNVNVGFTTAAALIFAPAIGICRHWRVGRFGRGHGHCRHCAGRVHAPVRTVGPPDGLQAGGGQSGSRRFRRPRCRGHGR